MIRFWLFLGENLRRRLRSSWWRSNTCPRKKKGEKKGLAEFGPVALLLLLYKKELRRRRFLQFPVGRLSAFSGENPPSYEYGAATAAQMDRLGPLDIGPS